MGKVYARLCECADTRSCIQLAPSESKPTLHTFLPALPNSEPRNRLALAKWTVSPDNPLTARVTVNRMWYELFGTGIVETTEDFGIMGQRPYSSRVAGLARRRIPRERMEHQAHVQADGDVGGVSAECESPIRSSLQTIREIFCCRTVRGSAWMPRCFATSLSNRAGCLVEKIGGPSVKPYQPPNIWEEVSYPDQRYRRLR